MQTSTLFFDPFWSNFQIFTFLLPVIRPCPLIWCKHYFPTTSRKYFSSLSLLLLLALLLLRRQRRHFYIALLISIVDIMFLVNYVYKCDYDMTSWNMNRHIFKKTNSHCHKMVLYSHSATLFDSEKFTYSFAFLFSNVKLFYNIIKDNWVIKDICFWHAWSTDEKLENVFGKLKKYLCNISASCMLPTNSSYMYIFLHTCSSIALLKVL